MLNRTTLDPETRVLYGDSLQPPPGYVFDAAIATTFSLDFETALAAPVNQAGSSSLIEKRAPSVNCGGKSYSSSLVNRCVNNSDNDAASSTTYPHKYNDYEGFDFSDYCSSDTFYEYPLTSSGYTGGSPGPDRCIPGSNGEFCGAITHTGTFSSSYCHVAT